MQTTCMNHMQSRTPRISAGEAKAPPKKRKYSPMNTQLYLYRSGLQKCLNHLQSRTPRISAGEAKAKPKKRKSVSLPIKRVCVLFSNPGTTSAPLVVALLQHPRGPEP